MGGVTVICARETERLGRIASLMKHISGRSPKDYMSSIAVIRLHVSIQTTFGWALIKITYGTCTLRGAASRQKDEINLP